MSLKDVAIGDQAPDIINVIIENPRGSRLKIEYDRDTDVFVLDRTHQTHLSSPCEYGFVPQTLDEDGDALDVLLESELPLSTGLVVSMRLIGVMYMVDSGEVDNKLIGVIEDDQSKAHIATYEDLGEQWRLGVQHYFEHYKDLKGSVVTIKGFAGIDEAKAVLAECQQRLRDEQSKHK